MSEAQVYIQCYAFYFLMVVSGLLAFFYYFTNIVLTDLYHLLLLSFLRGNQGSSLQDLC